jgi:uncharacterized protein
MSAKDNLGIVKKVFEAYGNEDVETGLKFMSDDIELQHPMPQETWSWAGKQSGKEKMVAFYAGLAEIVDFQIFETLEYIADGDKVAVITHEKNRFKSTGKSFEHEFIQLLTLKDGKIIQWRIFEDTAPIRKAGNLI